MIIYDPKKMLSKLAPESKIEKLISPKLGFKKSVFKTMFNADFLDKKNLKLTVLKTIKNYNERAATIGLDKDKDAEKDFEKLVANNPKLLIQRVQNAIVYQVSQEIKDKYQGDKYEWLPSDAEEPDPEHQLNYGKIFTIGDGEMPNERYGCRCGMRILTEDESLKL